MRRIGIVLALVVVASSLPARAGAARLTGTASYRERVALTPDAVFEATLEDVSRAGAPAVVIGRTRMQQPGQVPIRFAIDYDPGRIVETHAYTVRGTIRRDGQLLFTSTLANSVLTRGHGHIVTLLLLAVPGSDSEETASPFGSLPATFRGALPCADCAGLELQLQLLTGGGYLMKSTWLRDAQDVSTYEVGAWRLTPDGRTLSLDGGADARTQWAVADARTLRRIDRDRPADAGPAAELTRSDAPAPMEPRLRLRGTFRIVDGEPRFRECRSGIEWPVLQGDDYASLERAYVRQRRAPGADLLVTLAGRITTRPRPEATGMEPALRVERFLTAPPGESCAERSFSQGLENTRWRPIRVGGITVVVRDAQREPWIMFDPKSRRATGSGGCNRISGGYDAGETALRIGPIASTRMACPGTERVEAAFIHALEKTARYRVSGRMLELLDASGASLARLEERNLR